MLAAIYEKTGAAREVLRVVELPDPRPAAGEVRVKLATSGVNPSDVKTRAGRRTTVLPYPRIVPHSDGAGVIDAVGPGVPESRLGERVWVWNACWGRADGTAANYVALPSAQAVPLPASVSFAAGACLGIPALTALHAVLMDGGVAGKTVLVAGGAGAVGHYAVQFASRLGAAKVIASVSTEEKAAIARAAGADEVVRYRDEPLAQRVLELTGGQGVDRVIEVDIAANAAADVQVLRAGGECVVYGSGRSPYELPFFPWIAKNLQLKFFIVYHLAAADRARAEAVLARMLARGELSHAIAARLPLEEIAAAHELVERGAATGNVVLRVGAG